MKTIVKKIILTAAISFSIASSVHAGARGIITGPPPNSTWTAVYSVFGIAHGVTGLTYSDCQQNLANATNGLPYTIIQPCSSL